MPKQPTKPRSTENKRQLTIFGTVVTEVFLISVGKAGKLLTMLCLLANWGFTPVAPICCPPVWRHFATSVSPKRKFAVTLEPRPSRPFAVRVSPRPAHPSTASSMAAFLLTDAFFSLFVVLGMEPRTFYRLSKHY